MKKLLMIALLCVAAAMFSRGASAQTTLDLSDCSQSSLQTEWNLMSSGAYVLQFPSCAAGGTGTWTNQLSLTMPSSVTSVTLQGNTSVTCSGTPGSSGYSCTYTDGTVIEDDYASNNPLLILSTNSGTSNLLRITGLTLVTDSSLGSSYTKWNGIWNVDGNGAQLRVDHDHLNGSEFTFQPTNGIRLYGIVTGVADHNYVQGNWGAFALYNSSGYGDAAWQSPTQWGSSNFFFIESNYFAPGGGGPEDCASGGRFVVRYNTLSGGSQNAALLTHPTNDDAGGRDRGCRAWEFYNNYITGNNSDEQDAATFIMSGPGVAWGNTVASGYYRIYSLITSREAGNYPPSPYGITWGQCGKNTNGDNTNTPSNWDGNSVVSTGYPCLDGQGRGATQQQIAGATPLNQSTGTVAWPQQYLEPTYMWDNTNSSPYGTLYEIGADDTITTANRDFFPDNASFTGTNGGTGWGLLASRPSSCTPGPGGTYGASPTGSYGVGYFATDANSGIGQLYICTATNTWTAVYSPYPYPHPLVSGGGGGDSTLNPPAISPGSGSYASPQTVTITPPSGATVCYRTDGDAPTASTPGTCDSGSTTYSGPFSLAIPTTGAVVQAISTESGQINSSVATASYTLQTCLNTPLGANWTCISDATNYTSASGTSLAAGPFSVNPPAGSLIVVFQFNGSNAPCVVPTDTLGTTFTGISSATVSADSMELCDWYGVVGASGLDSVTCEATATASSMGCSVVNVPGQSTGMIVDQSCVRSNALSASGINNMTCSNSINVGAPNELAVAAAFGDYGVRSAGTNFTMIDPNNWSGEYFM